MSNPLRAPAFRSFFPRIPILLPQHTAQGTSSSLVKIIKQFLATLAITRSQRPLSKNWAPYIS